MTKMIRQGFLLGIVGLAAVSMADSSVTAVKHVKKPDGTHTFVISGTNLAKPKVLRVMNDTTYIVEFSGKLATTKSKIPVNSAGIDYVQLGWYTAKPPRVRFSMKIDAAVNPQLSTEKGNWIVTIPSPASRVPASTAEVSGTTVPKLPYPKETVPPPGTIFPEKQEAKEALIDKVTSVAPPLPVSKDYVPFGTQPVQTSTDTLQANQRVASGDNRSLSAAGNMQMVSLDFVGTDIMQILKALSIQSNVNIVASPDVSPADKPVKLTVSLNRVSLEDALAYVTAISGLRYARVGNSYVVTPRDSFSDVMRQMMERTGANYETRVINLVSGQAAQIRDATVKAMPPAGRNGYYEVVVPSAGDLPGVAITPNATGTPPQGGAPAPGNTAPRAARVYFLMIIGDGSRLDDVEKYIRELDQRIVNSSSLNYREDVSTKVFPVQSGESGRIKMMIDRLVAEHPRAAEFTVSESILEGTTKGESQTMALLMIGPKDEVGKLESFAKALDKELCAVMGRTFEDDAGGLEKVWEVVEVNFAEPTLLVHDLKARFKGVQISLMPDAVTPGIGGTTSSTEQTSGATGTGTGSGTGAAADGGTQTSGGSTTEERAITGREPMRIVLRGTQSQIEATKEYIALVDVAPRQIALELRVMELTKEEAMRIGLDWNIITGGRLTQVRLNQGVGDTASSGGSISGGDTVNKPFGENWFLASLDKMNNGRNLIARPNALVSDGRTTNLFVGDTVRYIKSIQSTQQGVTVETGEVQVGVRFNIQGRIGGDGQIAMSLDQNFSILTGFTPVPGGGQLPQTSDRITNMFVNMKSGETLAIGGLILEQDRKRHSGIPLLKDLPIIGHLFGRTDNSKVRTEIVFFLTANVVDHTNRANAAAPPSKLSTAPDPDRSGKSGSGQ
ncbi:AMIN domain-containing protein [Kamptonema cortianum]|nr:AMIN domain-containing protein [Geitlerinema splendidum]MDK3155295.1 AMIN domain-containing protein [Kamptonema cortianum]